jgi:putative peptidoglycan lipid II flippase
VSAPVEPVPDDSTSLDEAPRAGLVRASAAVAAGTLLSRVTGLVRVLVLAYALGKFTLADTYNLANTTPNIVYELVLGGVLSATLVPLFVDHLARGDERATSAVFTVTLTALIGLTVVAMVAAPLIARLYAIDTSGSQRSAQIHVMVLFTLAFMPQMIFYGFTALATAVLNAHRRFVAAAFAPVVNNVLVIAVLLAFAARIADDRAAWTDVARIRDDVGMLVLLGVGTTAGIVAMALVLVPALRRAQVRLRPVFEWRHPAVITMLRLSGWTVAYVVTNQIALLFVLVLAKSGDAGDVSAYIYAYAFYQLPHGLLAVSIMTTMTPELARRVTAGDEPGLRRDFALGLRYLVVLVLPASVLFVVLAQPMVGVLAIGNFSAADAAVTADVLQAMAISVIGFSIYLYALRLFYAFHDTRTPFFLNLFENVVNVVLAIALFPTFGVRGLALAWTGAYLLAAVVTLLAVRRRVGRIQGTAVVGTAWRAALASLALALVAAPVAEVIGHESAAKAVAATVVAAALGVVAYLAVLALLRTEELGAVLQVLRKGRVSPADV